PTFYTSVLNIVKRWNAASSDKKKERLLTDESFTDLFNSLEKKDLDKKSGRVCYNAITAKGNVKIFLLKIEGSLVNTKDSMMHETFITKLVLYVSPEETSGVHPEMKAIFETFGNVDTEISSVIDKFNEICRKAGRTDSILTYSSIINNE